MNQRIKSNNKFISLVLLFSMLLSVICVFPSYAEGEATGRALVSGSSLADGVYVFNNRLTGKFLASPGSSFGMLSGQMTNIGSDVQFSIRYVASGCYDIRLASNSYYLARSATSSNKNVVLQSSADIRYTLWKIETYTYNGYTYHYFYNSETYEYLIWQNGTLQVVSNLPYPGTEAFYACSWRVAKYADYVEPTTISIGDMWLPSGAEEQPVIHANPSNADLCAPFDFTYTCDTAYVGVDALEGYITPNNHTGSYTKTITATHKPTGVTTTFSLTMNPRTVLVGVDDANGHDHSSCLSSCVTNITNSGYIGAAVETGEFTTDEIDTFLDWDKNSLFISRSHAGPISLNNGYTSTALLLNIDQNNPVYYTGYRMLTSSSMDLSNMRIVVFVGCQSGNRNADFTLPEVAVALGAQVSVGFEVDINCNLANEWTKLFVDYLARGYTVQGAISTLNSVENNRFSVLSPMFCGDGTVTLN